MRFHSLPHEPSLWTVFQVPPLPFFLVVLVSLILVRLCTVLFYLSQMSQTFPLSSCYGIENEKYFRDWGGSLLVYTTLCFTLDSTIRHPR